MSLYVSGNRKRIFLNTALGCLCNCQYCYLPSIDMKKQINYITAEEAVNQLLQLDYFEKGKNGTILSIGCYSECFDKVNKKETIKLLNKIVKYGNYIQLATKQVIETEELNVINSLCCYKNQIGIYYSMPTISYSEIMESGTALPLKRLESLHNCSNCDNLYSVLYIKPVIKELTINDKDEYLKILKSEKTYCVVGSLLKKSEKTKQLVGGNWFEEDDNSDTELILQYLKSVQIIYKHSIDIIETLREK